MTPLHASMLARISRRVQLLSALLLSVAGIAFCSSCTHCAPNSGDGAALGANMSTKQRDHTPSGSAHLEDTRAMWLWDEAPGSQALIENRDDAQETLLAFLKAPHGETGRAINRVYFAAQAYTRADPLKAPHTVRYNPLLAKKPASSLRQLLRRLNKQGVATELLAGQGIWLASDAYAEIPIQICRDTVSFNRRSDDPEARFAGVHLDIEPHTVTRGPWAGQWWQERLSGGFNAAWTRRWKYILNSCRQILDAYRAETGHKLTLSIDVGSDFAHYNKPMHDFLNRDDGPLDYLVVLNYFDDRDNQRGQPAFFFGAHDGEQIVGGVQQNLESWSQLPLIFGVETGPAAIAADRTSFHQEGYQRLYRTLDTLLCDYASPRVLGVAIHHYGPDAYRDMQP